MHYGYYYFSTHYLYYDGALFPSCRRWKTSCCGTSSGSAAQPTDLSASAAQVLHVAADARPEGTQLVDMLLHVSLHCVPDSLSLAEVVAVVLQASSHLTPPLSFRVLRGTFAWLPATQIVVWTEPLPGMRVIPVHMGDGELDFCTVSVPVEASAYETAIQIALIRPEHERLRYHIARGSRVLFADGQRTEPFLALSQIISLPHPDTSTHLYPSPQWFLCTLPRSALRSAAKRWLSSCQPCRGHCHG